MATENLLFDASDGTRLEGRLGVPAEPLGTAVVCHPHPAYGGSMSNAIVPAVQRALVAAGWACLRFNFRGVGRSEGAYGGGIAELKDAAAALDTVASRWPDLPIALAGWSFGAMVGLHAAVADRRVGAYVAIAPPVAIQPHMELAPMPPAERLEGWNARVFAACGTTDPFCTPKSLQAWAAKLSPRAEVRIFDGEDHFFTSGREELARAVASFVAGT